MQLTQEQLTKIIPLNINIDGWFNALSKLLPDYEINTPQRIAAFMAECVHESAGFTALHENLNYSAASLTRVWPSRFPPDIAALYGGMPEKIANRAYADRMGNGPESSGDGWKYCGKGLIQITGRDNYQAFADSIETPLEQIPDYLQTFEGATQSACWFWENNKLNAWADQDNIDKISQIINGGTLGLAERHQNYTKFLAILNA